MGRELPKNLEVVKEAYDKLAGSFSPLLEERNSSKAEVDFMNKFISMIKKGGYIADLGCGVGKHGRYCAVRGFEVIGYDLSSEMIAKAKESNEEYGEMQFLKIADMRYITSEKLFDGVIAMYSLIHLTYDQSVEALQNISKYMADEAKIIISMYNGSLCGFISDPEDPDILNYFSYYTKEQVRRLIEESGFVIEEFIGWNDEDEITAMLHNDEGDVGVFGIIARKKGQ